MHSAADSDWSRAIGSLHGLILIGLLGLSGKLGRERQRESERGGEREREKEREGGREREGGGEGLREREGRGIEREK